MEPRTTRAGCRDGSIRTLVEREKEQPGQESFCLLSHFGVPIIRWQSFGFDPPPPWSV